jgi:hypothetical protein
MTLADVRAAAIDRALVGDDPETALALVGAVDSVVPKTTGGRTRSGNDTLVAAMLTVGCLAADDASRLDDRAWRPGTPTEPLVVAGAAAAVRIRNVDVDRAADLADCSITTLEAVVERQRRHEKES